MISTILNSNALIGNWACVVFKHFFLVIFFLQIILLILLAIIIGDVINIFTRNLFRGQSTCVNMSGTHFTPLGRPQKTFISLASSSFSKTIIVMIVLKASLFFLLLTMPLFFYFNFDTTPWLITNSSSLVIVFMVFFLAHIVKCKYPNESEMVQREARTDGPTRELASTHLLPTMMIVNNTIFQIEERQRLIVTLS